MTINEVDGVRIGPRANPQVIDMLTIIDILTMSVTSGWWPLEGDRVGFELLGERSQASHNVFGFTVNMRFET